MGYHSDKGEDRCTLCPANSYTNIYGAEYCTECDSSEYAYPGDTSCTPREPCTEKDYFYYYTPCRDDHTRSKLFNFSEPVICDKSAVNPQSELSVPCAACNPGYRRVGSKCLPCPDGTAAMRPGDTCTACEKGTFARKSLNFDRFDSWADLEGVRPSCQGECATTDGWRLLADDLDRYENTTVCIYGDIFLVINIMIIVSAYSFFMQWHWTRQHRGCNPDLRRRFGDCGSYLNEL